MEDQLDFAASKDDASSIHSIASVSVTSSIHDDDGDKENAATSFSDHDDDQENNDLLSPSLPKKKSVLKQRRRTSWVWKQFKDIADKKEYSLCILCNKDIFYGGSRSTGMLERHIQQRHPQVHHDELSSRANDTIEQGAQRSMSSFLVQCPTFESCLLKFMIKTYQPLRLTEIEEFRDMCLSLNKRAPILGVNHMQRLLKARFHEVQKQLIVIFKGQHFALTTDAWTSIAKVGYVTCTVHFIDNATWKLHSMVLGLFEKTGRSRATDCVTYAEQQMQEYHLQYSRMSAVVTDTEATMVAAGRIFVQHSEQANGKTAWHGCIDHQLELVTGIAFTDAPETMDAMSACRSIVNFFNSSSQAMGKLLSKQQAERAVKPIQDVATRWWSTYSMVERLLRLKNYLALLEEEGELDCNLSAQQWIIITDLKFLLQPFMIAQRLLEGEAYVTVSLIPYMIYKIRKGLQDIIVGPHSSHHVVATGRKMLQKMIQLFGSGDDGTVANENRTEGVRRRPKGIPLMVLMASLLDPRMKAGVGIPNQDTEQLWDTIKDEMVRIAREDENVENVNPLEQPLQVEEGGHNQGHMPQMQHRHAIDNMFDELNEHYFQEQARRLENNNGGHMQQDAVVAERIINNADAEITLYKEEPCLPIQDAEGKFSCPLKWWCTNHRKYKMMSQLAIRILCIPATSAPAERVFSVAGLTIAKDRARLAPETANELIFLHEAVPAIEKYWESCR